MLMRTFHLSPPPPPLSVIAHFGRKSDRRTRARTGFAAVRNLYISCAYSTTHHGSPTPLLDSLQRSLCLSSLRVNKPLLLALPNSFIPPHQSHPHADNFGSHTSIFHRVSCLPSCRNERNEHIYLTSSRPSPTCTDTFSNDCSGFAR